MPHVINCPQCKRQLRVPDELVGTEVKCPSCSVKFRAEAAGGVAAPPAPPPTMEEGIQEKQQSVRPRRRSAAADNDDDVDAGPAPSRAVLDEISNVSTALLVCGIINICFSLCGLGANLLSVGVGAAAA